MTNTKRVYDWLLATGEPSPRDTVLASLGEHAHEYDIDMIVSIFTGRLHEELPGGLALMGDEFHATEVFRNMMDFNGESVSDIIERAFDAVDFWSIAASSEKRTPTLTREQAMAAHPAGKGRPIA